MSVGDLAERDERPAYVRFERRAVENKALSLEKGCSVSVDEDFVLITPPYSKDLVEMKVGTWMDNTRRNVKNGRTPKAWLDHWMKAYDAFKNGQEAPVHGMAIKEWSAISPAQIKNLIAINILTVQDLAAVNDQGLARIGMGGQELKRKAINWLKSTEDHGGVTLKVTQLEIENNRLRTNVDALESKIKVLVGQVEALKTPMQSVPTQQAGIEASDIMPEAEIIASPEKIDPELSLSEQYEVKFGKKPHHKMLDDTIRKKLEE